jgi:hypothetical protein
VLLPASPRSGDLVAPLALVCAVLVAGFFAPALVNLTEPADPTSFYGSPGLAKVFCARHYLRGRPIGGKLRLISETGRGFRQALARKRRVIARAMRRYGAVGLLGEKNS